MSRPPIKLHNKKLRRRLDGLSGKCYEYGELDDIELALFVHNRAKDSFYSYVSVEQAWSWINRDHLRNHPRSKYQGPSELADSIRKKRLNSSNAAKKQKWKVSEPKTGKNLTSNEQRSNVLPKRITRSQATTIPDPPKFELSLLRNSKRWRRDE